MDLESETTEFKTQCPHCLYQHDGHTSVDQDGAAPKPGDISLCFDCVQISQYGSDLQLELIPTKRYNEVMRDRQLRSVMAQLAFQKIAAKARSGKDK